MKPLLLALSMLVLLPQVIPAYSGEKKCWNKSGHCRKRCKDGEAVRETCKNLRVCCIPSNDNHRQVPTTSSTLLNDSSPGILDDIVTVRFTTDYFEVSSKKDVVEESESGWGTQTSLPNVHHSS
ncbi:defensin beta 118 [Saimiri boliviensis]|uniref:Beta-defensin n=1 Tax=Saimiri boliviensis boliviensis TaxID=39432 RepID=A0A2K6SKT5_SAIBB|nr:beta-defensin 118 [Saimiri boliviensis boliviensis]